MLGIIDLVMASANRVTDKERAGAHKFSKYTLDRESNLTWICFLPRRAPFNVAQKYRLLPKSGNIIAYEVPLNLIASNPHLTRQAFFSLIKDFKNTYNSLALSKKDIAFLGISVGSMPAFFLANKYKTKKIRIICSTARLGEGIFHAFAAKNIKKEALVNDFDEKMYDEVLNEINPIRNISYLPDDIKIVIARFDQYIPYKGALALIEAIRRNKSTAKIHTHSLFGHFLTMLRVGWLNKKNDFFG